VGLPDSDPIIRKALALGGDEAIRVNTDSSDGYYIASQIAAIAREGAYDLILPVRRQLITTVLPSVGCYRN